MKIKPLEGHILVELTPDTESGGILIPERSRENKIGVVKEIGAWRRTRKGLALIPEVRKGDRVLFNQHRGRQLNDQHYRLKLLHQDDVLAVLT